MLGNGIITIELKVQTLDVQSRIDAGASGVKLVRSARGKEMKARALAPATQGLVAPLTVVVGPLNKSFPPSNPPPLPLPRLPKPLAWRQGPRLAHCFLTWLTYIVLICIFSKILGVIL